MKQEMEPAYKNLNEKENLNRKLMEENNMSPNENYLNLKEELRTTLNRIEIFKKMKKIFRM
jgi:hypothetical protein